MSAALADHVRWSSYENGDAAPEVTLTGPRNLRNVSAIEIRNLTPFPVQDAFATALTQPSEQPQFTAQGRLADDLDVTVGRKRGRKVSTSSVATLRSLRSDADEVQAPSLGGEGHGKRMTTSRVSSSSDGTGVGASRKAPPLSGSAPAVRPNRPRTSSTASYVASHDTGSTVGVSVPSTSSSALSRLWPDNSQRGLEQVVSSRLVETFLTITVPGHGGLPCDDAADPPSKSGTPDVRPKSRSSHAPSGVRRESLASSRHKSSLSASAGSSQKGINGVSPASHMRSTSLKTPPSHPKPTPPSSRPASSTRPSAVSSPPTHSSPGDPFPTPDYISPIHRPSTNPKFPLDPWSGREFPEWTDLTSSIFLVQLWGKVEGWGYDSDPKGKGKAKAKNVDSPESKEKLQWKVLEQWNVDLSKLSPLSDDYATHPSHIPFNTLLVALGPYGQVYYIPSSSLAPSASRPPSPSAGYNSDPETGAHQTTSAGDLILPSDSHEPQEHPTERVFHSDEWRAGQSRRLRADLKSASWHDLVKLVTLQTCVLDTRQSLSDRVREIDKHLDDGFTSMKREASERDAWVKQLRSECQEVASTCEELKIRIQSRKASLAERRAMLAEAKEIHEANLCGVAESEVDLAEHRDVLLALRNRFPLVRTRLISTLASIFPIELSSPPDLLFTILDVPLPIPSSTTDPAPPLSDPLHKEVTEDAVATALGFAAQVVQLLASYLGKRLVYPVTCFGSRSCIMDNISPITGTRSFPLFSRGVENFRFEYGVYLLNKDIEMLMLDRDLRAMDMRHTLPNLKNLLLTLTDGEVASMAPPRIVHHSPPASLAGTGSVSLAEPASPAKTVTDLPPESSRSATDGTPPPSGSTTPTAPHDTSTLSRMSRPFLALSSFGLLRTRSLSTEPVIVRPTDDGPETPVADRVETPSQTPTIPEGALHRCGRSEDDEERRTIRGISLSGGSPAESKPIKNGVNEVDDGHEEKSPSEGASLRSISPPLVHVK
ncbi:hypothetical protein JAAARDRAFT_38027 [Jaapia argillacea MUCL 33604]|uniref:Autophagy-related protein 14 n=1 Tax=Jaapia argillacea MUCL 33604 TaxID=933084 RepID=A0A067PJ32_9AGAM|nr:hypothetical protein JAAARDRAFT_38027 [Jaapia argillacea MUCL 33604]